MTGAVPNVSAVLVILTLSVCTAIIVMLLIKMQRQRREYQTLFESVPCAITVQDRNYRIIRYNNEFAEGFTPSPERFCYQVYKGRTRKCEICPVEQTFEDGKTHVSEETRQNPDGSRKHWIVKTAPVKNAKGEIVAAIEMCLDVTDRKILEEELARSEKKYHAIFNAIPNPVFVLEPESFEILDCNKSVKPVYGYLREEMLHRSFLDFFSEDHKRPYGFKLKGAGEIHHVRHIGKRGKNLLVDIRISPSEYGGEQVVLATVSDITKRLEMEQQLSQAAKLSTLGEMATGVAHELNQPLTVIKMASGYFMKKLGNREPIPLEVLQTMCEKINANVDRANKIISHMRDFARKSDMTLDKVRVNDAVAKAYEIFSQQLKLRKIEVVWKLDQELPPILADSGRLEQVFINLLVNARDAIDERWVKDDDGDDERKILIRTARQSHRVIAEVADSGVGVPDAVADKIFEPFFTTKEVGKGTGLGLSISYGIVKDFGGQIRLAPSPLKGACFHLEFPEYRDPEETANGIG